MNKRKAKVCTALLAIIFFALWIASVFIENSEGTTLYEFLEGLLFPCFAGCSMGKCITRFYEWLTKTDE